MRILHIISSPEGLGGAELLLASMAKRAVARGHEVRILNVFEAQDAAPLLRAACAPVLVQSRKARSPRDVLALRRWLQRYVDEHRPDVVHVHLARALVLVATLRRRPGSALLLTHHHGDLFLTQGRQLARAAEALAGRRYDPVIAVSPSVGRTLVERLGYQQDRVRVIVNGWSGQPLEGAPETSPRRIVCLARLRPEKGHHVLLEAFAQLRHTVPDLALDLLGDGPFRAQLESHCRRLGLAQSVVFHGQVNDIWPSLARASLAVQPSLVEPLGISALEAMAAGVPLVASATGGLADIVVPEQSGLLVPPGDAEALAAAMGRVLADNHLAGALSTGAVARANEFRLARTLDAYDDVYASLAPAAAGGS